MVLFSLLYGCNTKSILQFFDGQCKQSQFTSQQAGNCITNQKNEHIFNLSRETARVQGKWILERLLQSYGWLTLARPSTLLYFCCRERGVQSPSYQPGGRFSQLCFHCKPQKTVKMVQSWFDNFLCQEILEENSFKNQSLSCLFAKSSQMRESTAKHNKYVPNGVIFKNQEN